MTISPVVQRVAEARRWTRLLGSTPIVAQGATIVTTPAHPDFWDGNFAMLDPGTDPAFDPRDALAALDAAMPHSRWRVVIADAIDPPDTEAVLALADFAPRPADIEMLCDSEIILPHPPAPIRLRAVSNDGDWAALDALVRIDHAEGKRTGPISDAVGNALIADMRADAPPGTYMLIALDGHDIGYGYIVACPNGLGMIDNLFTLPSARGQGVMSSFIAVAVGELRAHGCDAVFLDAHADDQPKHLYARLGFKPIALTRRWISERAEPL